MKRNGKISWGIGFVFLVLGMNGWAQKGLPKVVKPWRATTEIVKAGDSFDVWYVANEETIDSVTLKGPYHSVSTSINTLGGSWTYDKLSKNTYNRRITVTVPASAPADRYDLVINTSNGEQISPKSVKVVKAFKDQYYIMHYSDVHRSQGGYDEVHLLRKVSQMLKIANIMDVQMVWETGDNQYSIRNNPYREDYLFNGVPTEDIIGLHDTSAATFLVAGNHDAKNGNLYENDANTAETASFFNEYYGLFVYRFKYGNGRFFAVANSWGSGADPTGQGRDAAAWIAGDGAGGNFIMGAAHAKEGSFEVIYNEVPVDLSIVGHSHGYAVNNPLRLDGNKNTAEVGDPVQYVANAVRNPQDFEFNLFRVDNDTGNYDVLGSAQSRVKVVLDDSNDAIADPDQWVPMLDLTYTNANNGASSANTATIVNRYDFPIHGARIRYVLPKGSLYGVSEGTITQAFDGDDFHLVDVSLDVPANSTKHVDVFATVLSSNNADYVSNTIPRTMDPGETISVDVTMRNTGLDDWTSSAGHKLGAAPSISSIWGVSRVNVENTVSSGSETTFSFELTAPETRGSYDFQMRMVNDVPPNQNWFGASTPLLQIQVGAPDIQWEAEDHAATGGVILDEAQGSYGFIAQNTSDVGGGKNIGYADAGDYADYDLEISHGGTYYLLSRTASPSGGSFQFKAGETVLTTVAAAATGGNQTWATMTNTVTLSEGEQTLTIVANGGGFNINWFKLIPSDQRAPEFTSTPPRRVEVGAPYAYAPGASDADGDAFAFSAVSLPAWMSFDGTRLTGTPSNTHQGTNNVILRATDANGLFSEQYFDIIVAPVPQGGDLLLAIDFQVNPTDHTQSGFTGWALGEVGVGAPAPTTVIDGFTITLGAGSSSACLTNAVLQTGMNSRNRTGRFITNAGAFTQESMMRERVASLGSPTAPTSGNGVGTGLYLKIEGLSPETSYSARAWGVDFNGDQTLKNGYNHGFDATAETAGYTQLPELDSYTITGTPSSIPDNESFSVSGEMVSDANGTIIYKQISNIDKSVINGFTLSAVSAPVLTGYEAWASTNNVSTATADEDGDGRLNLFEYAMGGNPNVAEETGLDPILVMNGDALKFKFRQRTDDATLVYTMESNTNLASDGWTPVASETITNPPQGVIEEVMQSVPASDSALYFRLKVEKETR